MSRKLSIEQIEEFMSYAIIHAKSISQDENPKNYILNPLNRVLHYLWMKLPMAVNDSVGGYLQAPNRSQSLYLDDFTSDIEYRLKKYSDKPLNNSEARIMMVDFINNANLQLQQ